MSGVDSIVHLEVRGYLSGVDGGADEGEKEGRFRGLILTMRWVFDTTQRKPVLDIVRFVRLE